MNAATKDKSCAIKNASFFDKSAVQNNRPPLNKEFL